MSQNRSHLVPTIVTNKNGVQTTVHKKPTSTTPSTQLPKVTLTGKAPATKQPTAEWFTERLTPPVGISNETMLNASRSFFTPDPQLSELSHHLLTTGTSTGQRLAAESLSFYVGRVAERLKATGKTSLETTTHGGSFMHGTIIQRWNYGNIVEEAGLDTSAITEQDFKELRSAHSSVTMYESAYDKLPEEDQYTMSKGLETHWRGVSILLLAFDFEDESDAADDEWKRFDSFIPWAAHHPDIPKVIQAAKSHRTINPDKLKHLIEAKDNGVHDAMTGGWL